MSQGSCEGCGEVTWSLPLHGPKGGPLRCFKCAGAWNAEFGKRRKAGRVVVKALKAFFDAGGKFQDVERLRLVASGLQLASLLGSTDTIGAEVVDITSELLADALSLCHPDRHPEERKDLAKRVTQDLLALKPFVFPAPKPKPPPKPSDACSKQHHEHLNKPSQPAYPCEDCADATPSFYCDACKARWEKEQENKRGLEAKKRQEKNAKQRERYKWKCQFRFISCECAACGEHFNYYNKRADTRYCSASCRQAAYRKRDGKASNHKPAGHSEIETTIDNVFACNPHNAFSVDDLCDHAFPGERIRRKHRAAVVAAAKKVSRQTGEHRDWWRSDSRGRTLVFWNRASLMSYAIARRKADWIEGYHGSAERRSSLEEKFKADFSPGGGRYHEYIVRGGPWWKHCQEDLEKFQHLTDNQISAGVDLASRHAEAL